MLCMYLFQNDINIFRNHYFNIIHVSVKKIVTRMKSLRDVYNKNRKPKPTGSGQKPLSATNQRIMEMCGFLKAHVTSRESKSNLKKLEEELQVTIDKAVYREYDIVQCKFNNKLCLNHIIK